MDTDTYKIDLLCLDQTGPYNGKMPNCSVIPQDTVWLHLMKFGKNLNLINNSITYLYKALNKISGIFTRKNLIQRKIKQLGEKLSDKYDVTVAYSEGIAAQIAVGIRCPNKLVWIHNDYSFDCARGDKGTSFENFNTIVCVSDATKKSFINTFPHLKDKTFTVYNIINDDFILGSSNEFIPTEYDNHNFNIISVGRICYQKNFTIIPEILCKIDKEIRNKIKWYIVGDGPENELNLLKDKIIDYNVSDCCILIGRKDNPYPYIKYANLFVLTSRYESYPTVINEALVLGTPILSIDIPPAHEMIDDSRIFSKDLLPDAIKNEFIGSTLQEKYARSYRNHNDTVLSKLYSLFKL